MCGIAGSVNWSSEPVDIHTLRAMIGAVRHRGPDDVGVITPASNVGLAHARLSIIDIASGQQPMSNEDGSLWVTFNGEIFNYVELRRQLEERGHRFSTQSDTEVILHAYEEKGDRCVDDFNGQWAFAIWDNRSRSLFLSRDRMGVRPLYYSTTGQTFSFGSEVKSLLHHPRTPRGLDVQALRQTFTYWHPLPPRTPFIGICELPPAHSMVVTEAGTTVSRYWEPHYRDTAGGRREEDYAEELVALMRDATRIRLRADVPVGAYLSGGLDSTIVMSLARSLTSAPFKTFSISFDDPEFDESTYQRTAVAHFHTEHRDVRCSYADIGKAFEQVVWHAERTVLRTAPAPLFLLSALVRQHGYKVVLTGEGSDELFGGYDLFKEAKIRAFWARVPHSRWRPLLLKRLYPYLPQVQLQSSEYLASFFAVRPGDIGSPFFSHLPRWQMTAGLQRLLSEDLRVTLRDANYDELEAQLPQAFASWDLFSKASYLETTGLLPGYILSSQGDRVAMAHGVEGRFPFLDHRVVEFAMGLPSTLKMRTLREKYLLKRAFLPSIPAEIAGRFKQPYRAPDARSLFGTPQAPLRHDYVEELLTPAKIQEFGMFSATAVSGLVRKAKRGELTSVRDNMGLVGVLSTQLLIERFLGRFTG